MSAEDELGLPVAWKFATEPDAAAFARFWDDTASDDTNIQIIRWWLNHAGRCSPDGMVRQQFGYRPTHYSDSAAK